MKELVNSYLGQYYLTEVIGRGSTSVVYKAYQSSLNRYVAIKVLTNYADPQFAVRFKREAHAVAQLQHPNILPIYDYGEQGSISYFVTQYVEGSTTLADMLAGRPSEPLAALALMQPLLSALTYAHGHGVVHRDIKPANIMMPRPDWPMLADFGIAKLLDDSQQLTPPGQSVGTAIYMAPERATSSTADVRTDLYSIGVVLYEMLTGQVPFSGVSPVEVLRKHVRMPPPPPTSINPDLPAPLEPVLLRALEKDPADRYQSAAELSQALERARGQIERLNAQRQLQQMLQQQPAAGPAAAPNPYQTRTLPPVTEPAGWIGPAGAPRGGMRAGLIAVLLLAAIGGLVIFGAARGLARNGDQAGAPTVSVPTSADTPAATPAAAEPTALAPTALAAEQPAAAEPTLAPAAATDTPPAPPAAASTPQILQQGQQITVRLEDTDWLGGYRRPAGRTYGGRTATWVYGTSTPYSAMEASFLVAGQPAGRATLTIEGMDSEDRIKTPISIQVNGAEIFSGPNPLPDDDHPLETGTWASYSWTFDAALLRPGRNQIRIVNLAEGAFSLPPFFMLDYADVSYEQR